MTSEVDICNLALGHLGDRATVSSIDPPEGSAQAEHCARFYPIARDSMLELHDWAFATRRVDLAPLSENDSDWGYAYAAPSQMLRVQAILPPLSPLSSGTYVPPDTVLPGASRVGSDYPRDFIVETASDGSRIIYTNQKDAICRYTARISDPNVFSQLFTMALVHHLASMLAGPVIKGKQGAAEARTQTQTMGQYLAQARVSDANQNRVRPESTAPWIADR